MYRLALSSLSLLVLAGCAVDRATVLEQQERQLEAVRQARAADPMPQPQPVFEPPRAAPPAAAPQPVVAPAPQLVIEPAPQPAPVSVPAPPKIAPPKIAPAKVAPPNVTPSKVTSAPVIAAAPVVPPQAVQTPVDLVAGGNVAPAAPMAVPSTGQPRYAAQISDVQRQAAERALATVNNFRAQFGYKPLRLSDRLSLIAQAHVIDLAARAAVTSQDRQGNGVGVRLLNQGYNPKVAGSLVSGGYPDFNAAFETWRVSQVERSRLLLPKAEELGFAIITDRQSTYGTYIEAIVAAE